MNATRPTVAKSLRESGAARDGGLVIESGADIFAAHAQQVRYVYADLQIATSARPTGAIGRRDSRKSLIWQSLLVSAAAGASAWGRFPCALDPIAVLLLNYDQPRAVANQRLKRFAYTPDLREACAQNYSAISNPRVYLNTPHATERIGDAIAKCGAQLVVVDALRSGAPNDDENDSRFRRNLDVLTEISEQTDSAIVVVHHSSEKPGAHKSRGSSAILDGLGCVFVLEPRDGATMVKHDRPALESYGTRLDPFVLAVEDVEVRGNPHGGLRVVARAPAVVAVELDATKRAKALTYVAAHPGCSQRDLERLLGGKATKTREMIRTLVSLGDIRRDGGGYVRTITNGSGAQACQ